MGFQPIDSRGFFMLPQAPEGAGYYVYGTPLHGAGQYAHPEMMTLLLWVANRWQETESRKFGVGNISKADGPEFKPHKSHVNGMQVDVRAVRKDGKHTGVAWQNADYDREATAKLITIFKAYHSVEKIFFNDPLILGVWPRFLHDNHFHVELRK